VAAVASPPVEVREMRYQIVDAVMARSIPADAARSHPLFAWIIMRDLPEYPGSLVARLVTETSTPYILLGHTLAEVQAQLPPGLERSDRQPADPLPHGIGYNLAYIGRDSLPFRIDVFQALRPSNLQSSQTFALGVV
jgi:hypothetical protein